MTDGAAPFHRLPGDARPVPRALWARADDGVRLRLALWAATAGAADAGGAAADAGRGTVLLLPGRSEYVEKYAPVATRLAATGRTVLAIDWRGQGASDRLLADPLPGHVADFADYQRDLAAMTGLAEGLGLPRPWHLLSHSMGGAIALRALTRGLAVATAAFSAPMFGIRAGGPLPEGAASLAASGLAGLLVAFGRGGRPLPPMRAQGGVDRRAAPTDAGFATNLLTSDRAEWDRFTAEAAAWPELMIGAPTFQWVGAALRECRALARLPSPALPVLISLSGDEGIVSTRAIRARAARWPGATLLDLPGARHEALFEAPATRNRLLDAVTALMDGQAHGGAAARGT